MTVLWIILGLLGLILLLLFSSLTLSVDYDKKLVVALKFLGIKIPLDKSRKNKKKKKPKEPTPLEKKWKAKGFCDKIKFAVKTLKSVMPQIKYVLSHIRVRKLEAEIRVANPDAAKTAIEYGGVCSVVYPFLSFAQEYVDISIGRVDVFAAFGEEKCSFRAHLKIKIRVIILLIAVFKLLPIYQKLMEVPQNERKKHRFHN